VRLQIKGGIWKNSEDEILKAAVMKYGLNNWPRVSSLLIRKTAKQCKARWYEWLDPSVKKTEWTKDENEKLLHLAKLFPIQWRTIAPIVGRTANQCLEHYERLLDQAQGREEMPDDDPRRLKPGEVDPNPHTKPARADAVDMDEDEKEMLTEARARLANTRGKKAKRKAREKSLEEARRLAALQKHRELKAAGISIRQRTQRKGRIDYGTEIPFEQKVPAGFHETGPEEDPITSLGLKNLSLAQLENRNRLQTELRMRKDDERKIKRLKKDDLPAAIEIINKLNDPKNTKKNSKLILPAPQLQDWELEHIAKVGDKTAEMADGSLGLVQSYGQTPLGSLSGGPGHTPGRTPFKNTVMIEAKNAIKRNAMQTPLHGGDNPDMEESDFSGVMPRSMRTQTPRTDAHTGLKTPSSTPFADLVGMGKTPLGGGTLGGGTPMSMGGMMTPGTGTPNMTPGSTPMQGMPGEGMTPGRTSSSVGGGMTPRDALSLNEKFDSRENPFLAHQNASMQVKHALRHMPKPQNEVELVVPELDEESEAPDVFMEDAEDRERREAEEVERRAEEERKRRSQVIQKDGLRPYLPQMVNFEPSLPSGFDDAEKLIFEEIEKQVARDAYLFPIKGVKPPKTLIPQDDLPWEELEEIKKQVEIDAQLEHGEAPEYMDISQEFIYVPRTKKYEFVESVPLNDQVASIREEFEKIKANMSKDNKKVEKLETKANMLMGGHVLAMKKSLARIKTQFDEKTKLICELEAFTQLKRQEEVAVKMRLEELTAIVKEERERNIQIQKDYKILMQVKDELEKYLE